MSVQILKTGNVNASGEIGANLIADTTNEVRTYTYPSSGYKDWVTKHTLIVPTATNYILSFWAKSTVDGDKIRAHYYNPNTTTYGESSQGTTSTSVDGNMTFTLSTEWEFYWVVWTQSTTTSNKIVIFPRVFSQASGGATGTGTISIKCVKFEEGTKPTLWIPSTADTDYFTNICGFNEMDSTKASIAKEYINATDFIEI